MRAKAGHVGFILLLTLAMVTVCDKDEPPTLPQSFQTLADLVVEA